MVRLKEMDISIKCGDCTSCSILIEETFNDIDGIYNAQYILVSNKLHLEVDYSTISFHKIQTIIESLGFQVLVDEVTLKIIGMHCASCTMNTENFLMRLDGVYDVKANLNSQNAHIIYDSSKTTINDMEDVIKKLGFKVIGIDGEVQINEEDLFRKNQRWKLIRIIIGLLFTIILFIIMKTNYTVYGLTVAQFSLLISILPFLFVSYPILKAGFNSIANKNLNMDVMYTLGILVAFISSVLGTFGIILDSSFMLYESALMLPSFLTIGRYLEANAKLKTSSSILKLMNLQPKSAIRILSNGYFEEVNISEIAIGDILLVKSGDKIPVDGLVIKGSSYVNESMLNGEAIPVLKKINSEVFAGTINEDNILEIKASKIGDQTVLSNIIKLVEKAQMSKPPIQKIADTAVKYFIPVILTIAIIVFIIWYFLLNATLLFSLTCLISVLVVACPCSLGLATPTAVTVGLGRASEFGILIKNGEVLETLPKVDIAVFDKTGTITIGKPVVDGVYGYGIEAHEFLKILASLELNSQHPISKAILNESKKYNLELYNIHEFQSIPGKGLRGKLDDEVIYAGNKSLFNGMLIPDDVLDFYNELVSKNKTVIILSKSAEIIGLCTLSDEIKPNSSALITYLNNMGIDTLMLTGDNEQTACYVSSEVGIKSFKSEVLPNEKLEIVKSLQKDSKVLFVGDGINDAPALTQADTGIAMGNGTDIAMESGDIVLIEGDLENCIAAIEFSKKVTTRIKQNIFWAFAYNILLIPCAAGILYYPFGIIFRPEWAALAMALSSITVISLSLMLKKYTPSIKNKSN